MRLARRALIGLRPRLVAALVLTAAVTLLVASLDVAGPLDRRLRNDAVSTTLATVTAARPTFADLLLVRASPRAFAHAAHRLRRRTGGDVYVWRPDGHAIASTDPDLLNDLQDVRPVLRRRRSTAIVRQIAGRYVARITVPVHAGRQRLVLEVGKPLTEAAAAGSVVRGALLTAGLIGLGTALVLGLLLAGPLIRRLDRLRTAALRVAREGSDAELPPVSGHDEIADLARALATMQARLREQEEARRAFVATASHELRTPLASLRLMLAMLREDLDRDAPDLAAVREEATRAEAQAARLGGLADELLQLSRLDAGTPLRHEPVHLDEVSRSVVAELAPRAAETGIELTLDSEEAWALGDPSGAARVVRILVDNATRYAPPGSHVVVSVRPGAVTVLDDGLGVPEDERELIFERFTRGRLTADHAGSGLGLAIGRELARRMGGDLRLEPSERGSRFAFTLVPTAAPADERPEVAAPG